MPSMTVTITSKDVGILRKIMRVLAMLHWNSRFGHSGTFGMSLDGDGDEGVTVSPIVTDDGTVEMDEFRQGVNNVAGVGYDVELGAERGFYGIFRDWKRDNRWYYADNGEQL